MPFVITIGFATDHELDSFVDRALPKVRGTRVDAPAAEPEEGALHRVAVAVTSQTAARDVCHLLKSFLAHDKKGLVDVTWNGPDGEKQAGQVSADAGREAEILAVRLGAAAKAHMDAEKAQ